MSALRSCVAAYIELVSAGRTLEAIERFYAEDVVVFENRELSRSGKAKCLATEQTALGRMTEPPSFKMLSFAVDETTETAFIEWLVRFQDTDGKPFRLEEVAVQKWSSGAISQERFYYEGMIDEGESEGHD